MNIMRKPQVNAFAIAIVSAFYSLVFIFTSGHMEFERILNHSQTLSSPFWNAWSAFLKQGNMKYIGYAYIALTAVIVILSLFKKKDYDEYQTSIFTKGLIASGLVMVILFPLALLLILSDSNYSVQAIMLLVVVHWSAALISDLLYVAKWCRG